MEKIHIKKAYIESYKRNQEGDRNLRRSFYQALATTSKEKSLSTNKFADSDLTAWDALDHFEVPALRDS